MTPIDTKTQKVQGSGATHREGGGTHGRRKEPRQTNPQGMTGTWEQAEGGKGGANQCGIRWLMQACVPGHRYKRRRLAGGRCGRCPGGRRSMTGKEVGSSCGREVLQQRPLIMGVSSREEKIKLPQKWLRQEGQGDRISCNH